MHSLAVSSLVSGLIFLSALLGMLIRRVSPADHFSSEAKDTIRLAVGLVVTMTGLVLGMLVSSAKNFYDSEKAQVAEMSSQVILFNDLLRTYGPETEQIRVDARRSVTVAVDRIWPLQKSEPVELRPQTADQELYKDLEKLTPKNDSQAAIKTQLMGMTGSMKRTYWVMYLQSVQTSMPIPLLVVVTSWLMAIFISFGVFAPRNSTVILTLIVCALSVSAAILIIMSMYLPFGGILKISPIAIRDALSQLTKGQ